jgi:hypothetical protein
MTEVAIQSLIPSLEAKAARLNAASDKANQILTNVERQLVDLNLGVEVWFDHPIHSTDLEGDVGATSTSKRVVQLLGFAKVLGKWSLAVKPMRLESGFFEGDMGCPFENRYSDGSPTFLLKASRSLRFAAVEVLPKFLAQVEDRVDKILEGVDRASAELQDSGSR